MNFLGLMTIWHLTTALLVPAFASCCLRAHTHTHAHSLTHTHTWQTGWFPQRYCVELD